MDKRLSFIQIAQLSCFFSLNQVPPLIESCDILLLDPSDLEYATILLDDFLVLKISGSALCQAAWNKADLVSSDHNLVLGVIREEWKEVSTLFSQRFHLAHVTPQIIHIQKGKVQKVWSGESVLEFDLLENFLGDSSHRSAQLYQILAFRMLDQSHELTQSGAFWHKKWLERFLYLAQKASLNSLVDQKVESFKSKCYHLLQSDWKDVPMKDRELFAQELILIKETWVQMIKHKGCL